MPYVVRVDGKSGEADKYYTSQRTKKENSKKAEQTLRNILDMPEDQEGYIVLQISQEQLEEAVAGLQQLKPIIAQQVALGNQKMGSSKEQTETDVREVTAHFDTAITAMYMLLNNFYEGADHDRGREKNSGNT